MFTDRHNQHISICLILFALLTVSTVQAQQSYDQLNFPALNDFNRPEVHTFQLDNGIKFYLVQDRELPLIKVRAKVRAGEVQVNNHKLGLSQVTGEAMRNGGTESIPSDSLNQLLENKAANMETGFGFSSGSARMNLLKEDFDTLLPVFIDLMVNPALPQEKIELAKKQLKSQISRRNDNQGQIAQREFSRLIYGKQSVYGRIPQYATVNNIERKDVESFHDQAFDGKDMRVGVVGDFDMDSMETRLRSAFASYPDGTENELRFPDINYQYQSTVNFIHKSDVNQSLIRMGHLGGKRTNPDYATIQVMNNILSGGFSGRILQKIRTELGLSYSPGGQFGMNTFYPGLFYVSVRTKSSSTAEVINAVKEVIRNLQTEKVTEEELNDAKSQFLNSLVFQYDSHEEVLSRQMDLAYKGLPSNTLERFVDSLKQVTREDVLKAARKYLKPDQMEILVVGNKQQIGDQLESFGSVNRIDISIPKPGSRDGEASTATGDTAAGKKWLKKMAATVLPEKGELGRLVVTTQSTQYNSRIPSGKMSMDKTVTIDFPDNMKTELNTPQGKMVMQLKDGKATRKVNGKVSELPASSARQIKNGLRRNFLNIASSSDTLTVASLGETTLDDSTYIQLSLKGLNHAPTLYIDPETYLPYMLTFSRFSSRQGETVTIKTYFDNWKTRNGIMYPFEQSSYRDDSKISGTKVEKINVVLE